MNWPNKLMPLFVALILVTSACVKPNDQQENKSTFDVSDVVLPSTIEAEAGADITLQATSGSVKQTDFVMLKGLSSNASFVSPVKKADDKSFTFTLDPDLVSGRYTLHITRGSEDRIVGLTTIRIVINDDLEPGSATIYGKVTCDGNGISGVGVSDGFEYVLTDNDGVYRINSKKELGCVFISLPSGYMPQTDGILPRIHAILTSEASVPERADFRLTQVDNQKFTLFVMGDMHLANRNNDRTEFRKFTKDIREYKAAHPDDNIYGITLGDMTWDQYWTSNNYYFPQYLDDMNSTVNGVDGLITFHTIGNHDHEMMATGDLLTEVKYVKDIAPTYYSFNLGAVHFIILDNIECTNDGTGNRTYDVYLDSDQTAWLKKDLANVDKTTPLVVSMHAPIYYDNSGNASLDPYIGYKQLGNIVSNFTGFQTVHFITGHTHRVLNVEKSNYFEHNSGAVCASWWWSQKLSKINIGTDGAPGGYAIWSVDGTSFKWQFRGTREPADYQFRSYDLNNIAFNTTFVANNMTKASDWAKNRFLELYAAHYPANSSNKVLINVWNYNPKWTVTVTENGKSLAVNQVKRLDPLHILALSAQRYNANISSDPSFITNWSTHMFEVQATSATSSLEITVKDEFGNTYSETMTRPKKFDLTSYYSGYNTNQ